jgi:hypothetical protein
VFEWVGELAVGGEVRMMGIKDAASWLYTESPWLC